MQQPQQRQTTPNSGAQGAGGTKKFQGHALDGRLIEGFSKVRLYNIIDFASISGGAFTIAIITFIVALSASALIFLDVTAIAVVIGGTFAVTLMGSSLKDFTRLFGGIATAFMRRVFDLSSSAIAFIEIAQTAKKHGLLKLQDKIGDFSGPSSFKNGMQGLIDGLPAQQVLNIVHIEIESEIERRYAAVKILRHAADVAPAMGLIGTLFGLVQLLANLNSPETLGPAMALALLTTLYGACLAHLVFNPIASKIEMVAAERAIIDQIIILTLESIIADENPRLLEYKLNSILPPSSRVNCFD